MFIEQIQSRQQCLPGLFNILKLRDMSEQIDKLRFVYRSSHSKVEASSSADFYNQTFNSRAAVLDKSIERAERLAKQDARARIV